MFEELVYRRPTSVSLIGYEITLKYNEAKNSYFGSSVFMSDHKKELIKIQFEKLKKDWENLTAFYSSISEIVDNNPYRSIIGMGRDVLPFIIEDLSKTQNHWFYALNKITGKNPIPENHAGNIELMTKDWLNWANENTVI